MAVRQLSCRISPLTYQSAYGPFKPINPDNACTLRITAAAGTELAGAYSSGTFSYLHVVGLSQIKQFTTHRPSSCTRDGWIRLPPIVQYSSLLPPVGVWSVSQYQCGGSPSQGPLKIVALVSRYLTKLTNLTLCLSLLLINLWQIHDCPLICYTVLLRPFEGLNPFQLGQKLAFSVTHLVRGLLSPSTELIPLGLHGLSLPVAFHPVGQDQILHCK